MHRRKARAGSAPPVDLERWSRAALRAIRAQLTAPGDRAFLRMLDAPVGALHLAVFVEPYLSLLLDGTKTIESRFSQRRSAPWGRVTEGDLMLLKAASGPVVAIARLGKVAFFDLRTEPLATIRAQFGTAIAADDEFWTWCEDANYATLVEVNQVRRLTPIACPKRDRRGWVVFPDPHVR